MSIDSPVYFSKYRLGLMAVFVLVVAILAKGLLINIWQWAVFVLILIGVSILTKGKNQLLHLASSDGLWDCLVRTSRKEELWQVQVDAMKDHGFCVVIDGVAIEPMMAPVQFVIFADMLDVDSYRKLRVMARF